MGDSTNDLGNKSSNKKEYHAPQLTLYGTVQGLTATSIQAGHVDDAAKGMSKSG